MSPIIALQPVTNAKTVSKRIIGGALLLLIAVTLSACGNKEKAAGQSLAKVDGQEITVLQLNDELQHAGDQQRFTKRQILDGLIDRQLLVAAALSEKIDRDPLIMQAIERDKAQILAQAYLRKKAPTFVKPSAIDVESFYQKNPDLFSQRKQYELRELIIDSRNQSPELVALMGSAKSLDEVATWLESKKVEFAPTHVARTSVDLGPDIAKIMKTMARGQLFTINEGPRSILVVLQEVKDTPVTEQAASAQIEQFLINKTNKDAEAAEVVHLHATAKIEYLNEGLLGKEKVAPVAAAMPVADKGTAANHIDRGVAGLK